MNESARSEELAKTANRRFAELRRQRPDEIQALGEYLKRARKAGALSARAKELMNLAMALATHCTPCVVRHAKMSLEQGATRHVRLDTALAAVGMGGGPAYTQTVYMIDAPQTWPIESGEANAEA